MAITSAVCNSFKTEILTAAHNFTVTTGNVFKLALYTSSATMSKTTTAYSSGNECPDSGSYAAGGGTLTNITPVLDSDTAVCDFADISFTTATLAAAGMMIYNSSASNKAVEVIDFGGVKNSTLGTFTITFPAAAAATAILRVA